MVVLTASPLPIGSYLTSAYQLGLNDSYSVLENQNDGLIHHLCFDTLIIVRAMVPIKTDFITGDVNFGLREYFRDT